MGMMKLKPYFAWTPAQIAELNRLWVDEGRSMRDIAEALGVTRNTIAGKIDRLHLKRGTAVQAWEPEKTDRLVKGLASFKTVGQVAREMGVTEQACYAKLKRMKQPVKSKRPLPRVLPRRHQEGAKFRLPPSPISLQFAAGEPAEGCVPLSRRMGAGDAIAALRAVECHWPIGDPFQDDYHYCSARVWRDGAPYCAYHTKEAAAPPRMR